MQSSTQIEVLRVIILSSSLIVLLLSARGDCEFMRPMYLSQPLKIRSPLLMTSNQLEDWLIPIPLSKVGRNTRYVRDEASPKSGNLDVYKTKNLVISDVKMDELSKQHGSHLLYGEQHNTGSSCLYKHSDCSKMLSETPVADHKLALSRVYKLMDDNARDTKTNLSMFDLERAAYYGEFKNRYFKNQKRINY